MAERDERGRFIKGTEAGPGRPARAREDRYYEIMMTKVTFSDWADIIDKAVSQAKRGDAIARKWLADYLIGPPIERKELSGGISLIVNWDEPNTD